MSVRPLKITFHLDGTGMVYDRNEPTTLDGIMAWCLAAYHTMGDPPGQNEPPIDIPLPLKKWRINGAWGWHASALFPDGPTVETTQYFRKRFRENRVEMAMGTANRQSGAFRDCQLPMPLLLCHQMVAYACGDRSTVHKILRRGVKYIGKMAAHGKGRVIAIDVEWIDADYSLVKDGRAMRWLPVENGPRLVRPRPPYWNNVGRVDCCFVGDEYVIDPGTIKTQIDS